MYNEVNKKRNYMEPKQVSNNIILNANKYIKICTHYLTTSEDKESLLRLSVKEVKQYS